MARPKKVRPITSTEVLEFIESTTLEMLEVIGRLIEKRIAQLKEAK
jgi:hypothetical protein